jgi:hypothetical protein
VNEGVKLSRSKKTRFHGGAVYVIRVVCIHNEECESIGVLGD